MAGDIRSRGGTGARSGSSVLRNGLYNVAGQAARGAVPLLTIPFLIRFLGIREYGVWSFAYAVLALMIMSEAGISVAVTVFLSKDLAHEDLHEANRTLSFILIGAVLLSFALGLILWLAGPLIGSSLAAFSNRERIDAGRALQVAGFAVTALILQRTLVGIEQAFNRYATINALDLVQSLLTNIAMVTVAWFGGKTVAMMKWQALANVILLVPHCGVVYRLLRGMRVRFEWSKRKTSQIFRYGVSTWISALGSAAFGQCDRLIVGALLGAPLLGVYSAITGITSKINAFSGTAVQPLVPSLSRDAGINVAAEGRIRQAVHLNALIAIESGIFLYLLANWVMRLMIPGATGPRDTLGLQIAAIIYALYSLNAPGYFILFAIHLPRTNAGVVLFSSIVSLGLIFLGARYFGLLGAVSGNVGYLLTIFLTVHGLRKVGIALRHYLAWLAFPLLALTGALVVEMVVQGNVWLKTTFLLVQGFLAVLWFLRERNESESVKLGIGQVSES
jgi:O-antigen/teichoic acid export membrane protein